MSIAESVRESVRVDRARILNAQNPACLYGLPAELICEICDYLPVAETFCLMISCARFWNGRNSIPTFVKVQQLVHTSYLKQPYRHDIVEARFHILRLMEFDKIYGKGTGSFCCWACMTTHRKSRFYRPQKPVNLKLSVEEQREDYSANIIRHCEFKCRRIWVGICHEMTFAGLRNLQLGMTFCEDKSSIIIPAGGCFSEHVEYDIKTKSLSSRFYLGRLSDLGLDGFDNLCKNASIPICPHKRINVLAEGFLRGMRPGYMYYCEGCPSGYYVKITSDGFIELHIYRYVSLAPRVSFTWSWISYCNINRGLVDHCRAFSDWLNRMYNPETGAVYNGGQFEMFAPARIPKFSFY
jgi:hypothetical protein